MQDHDLTNFRFQYSVGRVECPAQDCGERTCLLFGDEWNPWAHCFTCCRSGTWEWLSKGNHSNMLAQLAIRRYMHAAKVVFRLAGAGHAERMRYGIPTLLTDPVRKNFFGNFLCVGWLTDLRRTLNNLGHTCQSEHPIEWQRPMPFIPLEQYPGLVSGVCVLTADGPVKVLFPKIRQRVEPRLFLKMHFIDRAKHFDTLEGAFEEGRKMMLLGIDANLTCSP